MKLIFTGPDPLSPHIVHSGGQLTATTGFADFAREQGITVCWVDTMQSNFPAPSLATRLKRAACRLVRFTHLAAKGDADGAILFTGAGIGFFERSLMALAARVFGVPSLLMIRDGNFRLVYERSWKFRLLVRCLLRLPDRIGVQGESWRGLITAAGAPSDRVVVIPNWLNKIPRNDPKPLPAGRVLRLVFIGWLTEGKGVPELIAAMRMLARRGISVQLEMVGGGDLLDAVREAAASPELAGRLEVAGWLPPDSIDAVLDRSDILVLPSHAEGFPNVVLEALAHGLPVVATPVGAIPDSVIDGRNGAIVPVGDPAAIADAVAQYAADPSRIVEQSECALETARTLHHRTTNCRKLVAALDLDARVT